MKVDDQTKKTRSMSGVSAATLLALALFAGGNVIWAAAFQGEWPAVVVVTGSLLWFAIGMPAMMVAHEGIHGLAFILLNLGVPNFRLRYGVLRPSLTPYTHPIGPMPASAYRLGVLAPGLLLGVLPFLYALATANAYVAGWAIMNTAAAAGDFLIILELRGVPGHVPGEDCEDRIGFSIRWDLASQPTARDG